MATLTREQIIKQTKMKREKVHVPELGGDVFVCQLPVDEMAAWALKYNAIGTKEERILKTRQSVVIATCSDAKGKKLFKDGDMDVLGKICYSALDKIYEVAAKLNHITSDDEEELAKNS